MKWRVFKGEQSLFVVADSFSIEDGSLAFWNRVDAEAGFAMAMTEAIAPGHWSGVELTDD